MRKFTTDYFLENSPRYSVEGLESFASCQSPDVVLDIQEALKPFFRKMLLVAESSNGNALSLDSVDMVFSKVHEFKSFGVPDRFLQEGVARAMVEAGAALSTAAGAAATANPLVNGASAVIGGAKGLFSILGNLFSAFSEPAVMLFKQNIAGKVLSWFGLDPSHGLAKYITVALAQVPITQLPKLFTDCRFLVSILGKALPHFVVQSVDFGSSPIGTYVKTALTNQFNNADLVKKITDSLADSVCSSLFKTGGAIAKSGNSFVQQLNATAASEGQAQQPQQPQAK